MQTLARRTLVTGATGLVGNNVTRQLLDRGDAVRILVRENADRRAFAGLGVEICYGNVCDAAAVRSAAEGVDLIVHSAAIVKIGRTRLSQFRSVNVEGTRHVAQAARDAGARMVHVSSTDAIGVKSLEEPADEETPFDTRIRTPYLLTKYEAEQVVLEHVDKGLDAVIVNPSFMLGPWDWKPSSGEMLLAVARGSSWMAPHGYFSVADVRDVCRGILSAAQRGQAGRRYILSGQTMSYLDAWRLFAELTGGRRPLCRPGPIIRAITGWVGDVAGWITGEEPGFNTGAIRIANMPRHYTSQRAKDELGYTTRPVRETVEEAWRWFQEYGYAGTEFVRPLEETARPAGSSAPDRPAGSGSHSLHPAERTLR